MFLYPTYLKNLEKIPVTALTSTSTHMQSTSIKKFFFLSRHDMKFLVTKLFSMHGATMLYTVVHKIQKIPEHHKCQQVAHEIY